MQIKVIAMYGQSQCYLLSHVDAFRPYGLLPARVLCWWNFPGKNTGVGCHFLLQGIFPTPGSNPGLWHCRRILYHLSQMLVATHNGKRANNTHFFTICARNRTSFLPGLVLWCLLADPGISKGRALGLVLKGRIRLARPCHSVLWNAQGPANQWTPCVRDQRNLVGGCITKTCLFLRAGTRFGEGTGCWI